jgi:hypothetical protein
MQHPLYLSISLYPSRSPSAKVSSIRHVVRGDTIDDFGLIENIGIGIGSI